MTPAAIFLLLLVTVIAVLFVAAPLNRKAKRQADKGHELSALLAEQERVLTALQELDFDNQLGKIPAEEYPPQRQELLLKGAQVMRRLDELQKAGAASGGRQPKAPAPADPVGLSEEELEEMITRRRAARKQKAGGFCPHCGRPVLQADKFCPACGKPLA